MNTLISRQPNDTDNDVRDRALVARIADQNRDAFSELYVEYQPRLFKFIFRLIQDYDVADELVNDVMLGVWKGATKFRGEAKVSTWILGIAYRQTMRRVSKKSISLATDFDLDSLSATGDPNVEREDWVRAGIETLPPVQRAAVILVFYVGLTYEETARIADCPVSTIKTRMFHARRKLKDALEAKAQPAAFVCEEQHAKP